MSEHIDDVAQIVAASNSFSPACVLLPFVDIVDPSSYIQDMQSSLLASLSPRPLPALCISRR